MSRYPNGDLLVVFHTEIGASFPFGAGAARIDRDGYPVWFRQDYSHHWPQIEEDGSALTPGISIGIGSIPFPFKSADNPDDLNCDTNEPYLDTVNVIDDDGRLVESINLMDALLDSPFAFILQPRHNSCDRIQLNFMDRIGDDAGESCGMSPGGIVVSMRRPNAFAILDTARY